MQKGKTMADMMTFPETVEEFMNQYKITDTEQIYTNGAELVPIFRMKQWFEHDPEQRWIPCSERLPAYGEDVLISIGGYCNVGHIVSVNEEEQYNWYFSGWYHLPNDVDAWMPLPEPYNPT